MKAVNKNKRFLAIDFETANGQRDSACKVGFSEFEINLKIQKYIDECGKDIFKILDFEICSIREVEKFICPTLYYDEPYYGYDYHFANTYIHGISWKDVASTGGFDFVWKQNLEKPISKADYIVAHNYSFERSVINQSLKGFGINPPKPKWVCTLKLARKFWELNSYTLSNICDFLAVDLNHHDALSDAKALKGILNEGLKQFGYSFWDSIEAQ